MNDNFLSKLKKINQWRNILGKHNFWFNVTSFADVLLLQYTAYVTCSSHISEGLALSLLSGNNLQLIDFNINWHNVKDRVGISSLNTKATAVNIFDVMSRMLEKTRYEFKSCSYDIARCFKEFFKLLSYKFTNCLQQNISKE